MPSCMDAHSRRAHRMPMYAHSRLSYAANASSDILRGHATHPGMASVASPATPTVAPVRMRRMSYAMPDAVSNAVSDASV